MSNYHEALECPLLFRETEQPEQHVLEAAIWYDLFYKGGLHEALHFFFESLRNKDTPNYIKDTINTVFKSESLRERIMEEWNLYHGYDHAKRHERHMNRYAEYDLASRCIEECHLCFKELLNLQMVKPNFFCRTGHSFFWLASRSEKDSKEQEDLVEHILLLMDPGDLLRPFSVRGPGEDRYTIFQISTLVQTRFKICLSQLGSLLNDGLASLGPEQIRDICQFIDPRDADLLLNSGLDLGKPYPDDAAPGWFSVATRVDPVPMFSWFERRGYKQPKGLLKYAASHNSVEAARWLTDHDENRQDWWVAALIVAKSTDERSIEILRVILLKFGGKWEIGTLEEDIVIKVVEGVSEEAAKLKSQGKSLLKIENVAIEKMRKLKGLSGKVNVVGMTIMAGKAGLSRLEIVLEEMSQQV
jgi:hypothetical protein